MPLRQKLHFGIDLVGGTFLTLHVQTDKAIESNLVDNFQSIESRLRSAQDIRVDSHRIEKNEIVLTFDSLQDTQSAASFIKTEFPDFIQKVQEKEIRLSYSDAKIKEIKIDAVARNIEVLRTRVNRIGVADIPISSQGENIIVEMPDVSDPQQAKNMIGRAAQLDFRLVEEYAPTREDILYKFDGDLPGDKEILPGRDKREGFYLVTKYPEITGKYLKDAFAGIGGDSGVQPVVSFRFSDEGGQRFFDLTSRNIGRQ
jgi:preprotein translocase subunit SecD